MIAKTKNITQGQYIMDVVEKEHAKYVVMREYTSADPAASF